MTILQENRKTGKPKQGTNARLSPKIGLISNAGFGNLGNVATDRAMIENIRRRWPDAVIHSFSPYPEGAQQELDIPSFPTTSYLGNGWWEGSQEDKVANYLNRLAHRLRVFPSRFFRKLSISIIGSILELLAWIRAYRYLKTFDLLMVTGGGQLDDHCMGGRWGYPFTLLMWGVLAKLHNIKYAIVSVGAGPLDSGKSRWLIGRVLPLAQYRSYRDTDAKRYIREIVSFPKDDPVYPDLAHSLPLEQYPEATNSQKAKYRGDYRLVVSINPYIGWVMTDEITKLKPPYAYIGEGSFYEAYLNKLADFVSWLVQNQYKVVFIASDTSEPFHDYSRVSKDIRDILKTQGIAYAQDQIVEGSIQTIEDLIAQLSLTDVVVASRFHSVLLSQVMNKPVLALSFHSKIDLLMADTGQAEYCLQIDTFEIETLKERFTALEANSDSIKQQLAKRTEEYREALDEQYDRLLGSW